MRFKFFAGIILSLVVRSYSYSQTDTLQVVDENYREDQFYIGFSYNVMLNTPDGFQQRGFSGGLDLGFIRDFPFNERRNLALGIGFGWGIDMYNNNLFIGENSNDETILQVLNSSEIDYDSNRYTTHTIALPIEFRWRTSTPAIHKFWRIYSGFKFEYVYYFKSKLQQSDNLIEKNDFEGLNRLNYGATLSMGRGNLNLHVYYGLNSLIEGTTTDMQEVNLNLLQVGLIFYIL